ncbi:GIY-YIG nuclease family protein [Candidatus Nomurabacteria bacterium]|nr:GIY-YIG nuclease family protein [Candidatus Nomurabacteria bacterium]
MISNHTKKFYYIYVLKSGKDKNFYAGYTEDLKSRFEQHCKGQVSSAKDRRPLELTYSEACLISKKDAMHREKYLKTYHGKQFLRNRLKSYLTG